MPACSVRHRSLGAIAFALGSLFSLQSWAEDPDTAALAAAMKNARTTLEQGLGSAAKAGRPVSAKFEIDDGKLQLSVYVDGAGGFKEVVLDPQSGAAKPATKITDADDLKAASTQRTAMTKAKATLMSATRHAVSTHAGTLAISVYPELQNGHVVAVVTLLRGANFTQATEKLD